MMDCIFCKIARKEVPAEILAEDGDVIVFKDIKPGAPVHYLVVPKRHIESVQRLEKTDQSTIAAIVLAAKRAAHDLHLRGYKLIFNVGREGGQIVDHLHLHLMGGWEGENHQFPRPAQDGKSTWS